MASSPRFLASLRALERGAFADWLGGTGFAAHAAVVVSSTPNAGLGLRTSAPLEAGVTVISAPADVWQPWSTAHALSVVRERSPPLCAALERVATQSGSARLPETVALALHVLLSSQTEPYAATLSAPDSPLLWPAGEPALAALAGTRSAASVADRRSFVASLHASLGLALPASLLASALALVLSRALSGGGTPLTLVPGLDLLNHASPAGCSHRFDAERGEFTVTTARAHEAGEELCISYGLLCNDASLRLYGFTQPHCELDAALLPPPWPSPPSEAPELARRRRGALVRPEVVSAAASESGCWWDAATDASPIPVSSAVDGAALMAVLRVMHAPAAELGQEGTLLDARRPLGPVSEAAARASLQAAVAKALSRYPTSLGETEAALAARPTR